MKKAKTAIQRLCTWWEQEESNRDILILTRRGGSVHLCTRGDKLNVALASAMILDDIFKQEVINAILLVGSIKKGDVELPDMCSQIAVENTKE